MRQLPEDFTEYVLNTRWAIARRLELMEALALGSLGPVTDAGSREELKERMHRALERRDRKAEDQAILDYERDELEEWWRWFPERRLLTDLFWRDARRRAGCKCKGGSDCRRPYYLEGLRIARGLWADLQGASPLPLDVNWESSALSNVLADLYFPPYGSCSHVQLQEYEERSSSSRVHDEALERLVEEHRQRNRPIPRPLSKWQRKAGARLLRRPAKHPLPRHRPVIVDDLVRNVRVQFTVELLQRLGVRPQGRPSGCFITAEALGLSEETVRHIWNKPVWGEPYGFLPRKHMKAIATRHGLLRTTPV